MYFFLSGGQRKYIDTMGIWCIFILHMIKLANVVNEIIPFDKAPAVKAGLAKKYGSGEMDAYTFGIEFEYEPSSSEEVDENKLRLELENNSEVYGNYSEWVEEQRRDVNRRMYNDVSRWDNSYGPIDTDTYDSLVSEPEPRDFETDEEYDKAYDQWKSSRDDVEYEYNHWLRRDFDDYRDDYISWIIRSGEWERYVDRSSVADKSSIEDNVREAMSYIQNNMGENVQYGDSGKDVWGVGPDGENIEIRSKHLKQSEFELVKQISDYVSEQNVSGGTSAHVHIGLPDDFDAFDLLAITTLVDERAIKNQVGPGRDLASWAQLRDKLHNSIVNKLIKTPENQSTKEKSFVLSNERLFVLLSDLGRYWGTNVAAMRSKRTIEFRYLGSQIASNVVAFIKWIQYYLLLPKVAKSRNSVILKQTIGIDSQSVTAIRQSGSVKFVLNIGRYSTPNLPAADLKKGTIGVVSPKIAQAKKEKIAKISI